VISIVDYGVGNVRAIVNMLDFIGCEAILASNPLHILQASKLILPGVGSFDAAMQNINARDLTQPLRQAVLELGKPILGVCLGMQLLGEASEEGTESGLGFISAVTKRLIPTTTQYKVPHMGWSEVHPHVTCPLFPDSVPEQRYYFAHSYHVVCNNPGDVVATAQWCSPITAAIACGNVYGVQFHPEKSHRYGAALLRHFAHL
jgi:glutamine amidotransferase